MQQYAADVDKRMEALVMLNLFKKPIAEREFIHLTLDIEECEPGKSVVITDLSGADEKYKPWKVDLEVAMYFLLSSFSDRELQHRLITPDQASELFSEESLHRTFTGYFPFDQVFFQKMGLDLYEIHRDQSARVPIIAGGNRYYLCLLTPELAAELESRVKKFKEGDLDRRIAS
jgi:hypothetical protein